MIVSIFLVLLSALAVQAQTPTPPAPPKAAPAPAAATPAAPAKPAVDVTKLGTDFVDKLNTLDDWRLSMDGKEVGLDKIVDAFMADFAQDVIAELPSDDEEQIGPVGLIGPAQVRRWVEKFARTHVDLDILLVRQTEKTVEGEYMVFSRPLPWGGVGIAFPMLVPYALRENRQKFLEIGNVYLQYGPDQKVHRFQMYMSEKSPISGGREQ